MGFETEADSVVERLADVEWNPKYHCTNIYLCFKSQLFFSVMFQEVILLYASKQSNFVKGYHVYVYTQN